MVTLNVFYIGQNDAPSTPEMIEEFAADYLEQIQTSSFFIPKMQCNFYCTTFVYDDDSSFIVHCAQELSEDGRKKLKEQFDLEKLNSPDNKYFNEQIAIFAPHTVRLEQVPGTKPNKYLVCY